jgi:hypothetical protein
MAANLRPESEAWEELTVPPEVQLGTPPSDGQLQQESINMDSVEIAEEASSKIKVQIYRSIMLEIFYRQCTI